MHNFLTSCCWKAWRKQNHSDKFQKKYHKEIGKKKKAKNTSKFHCLASVLTDVITEKTSCILSMITVTVEDLIERLDNYSVLFQLPYMSTFSYCTCCTSAWKTIPPIHKQNPTAGNRRATEGWGWKGDEKHQLHTLQLMIKPVFCWEALVWLPAFSQPSCRQPSRALLLAAH